MIWLFSDGTVFELGGVVRGSSDLARTLRRDVELVRLGVPPSVVILAPGLEDLDLDSAEHVDVWLHERAGYWGVEIASAPDFERRPALPSRAPEGSEY